MCEHLNTTYIVCDQIYGVECSDCHEFLAADWGDELIPWELIKRTSPYEFFNMDCDCREVTCPIERSKRFWPWPK